MTNNQTQRGEITDKLAEAQLLLETAKQNAANADADHSRALTEHFLGRLNSKEFQKKEEAFRKVNDQVHDATLLVQGVQREHDEIMQEYEHQLAKKRADSLRRVNRRHNEALASLQRTLSQLVSDYAKLEELQQEARTHGWTPTTLHGRAMSTALVQAFKKKFNRWVNNDQWQPTISDSLGPDDKLAALCRDLFMTSAVRALLDEPTLKELPTDDGPIHDPDGSGELSIAEFGGDAGDDGASSGDAKRDLVGGPDDVVGPADTGEATTAT